MLLTIDDEFRVTSDAARLNFQLERWTPVENRKTKDITYQWIIEGFHGGSLRSVLLQYSKLTVMNDDKEMMVNELLDKLTEIDKTIVEVVKRENIKLASKSND